MRTRTHIQLLRRPRRRDIEIKDIHRQPQCHARIRNLESTQVSPIIRLPCHKSNNAERLHLHQPTPQHVPE